MQRLQLAQAELVRKEQLAVIGELAAVVAHEVRNPLAVISNAVAGLRKDGLAPEEDRRTLMDIVDEETNRINRLVGDLLPLLASGLSSTHIACALSLSSARWD
ncbi:MAG: histidine kinase dimerization/phospho-acceptor domain-containing protein [Polyangiaceae bacterium]